MQVISRRIVAFFEDYDVLLLPVLMHPPIKVGEWEKLPFEQTLAHIIKWVAPCPLANASGLPAIALPVGVDDNNLPIAIQIIGKPATETTIISLAATIEKIYQN
jgi:amidase